MISIKDSNRIGIKIKLRRKQLGISQEKLGEMIGVTYQQIQKYEKGTNKVSAERLHKIAQLLNVSTSFFFEDEEEIREAHKIGESLPFYQTLNNLSPQEQELVKYFRAITDEEYKFCFLSLLKQASKK